MTNAKEARLTQVECVAPVGDHCGEAATWSPAEGKLYWTDVNRFLVHRLTPETGAVETWFFEEPCVALALTDLPGHMLLALGSRLIDFQPDINLRTPLDARLDDWPSARFNDGRAGPGGEFWIGSMANNVGEDGRPGDVAPGRGALFRYMPGGGTELLKSGIGISNTVCFSPDQKHLYFGDTPRNVIWRYDYEAATRAISGETVFFEGFDRGLPDGSAIDAEGCLWNCRFGGRCIVRIRPDGSVDRVLEMPVSNVTTCEFGGADLSTLYITTANILLKHHERLAGSLFSARLGTPGAPPLHVRLKM
ncbi:MAG: SMP-30/gluconolactonase/LRE family protein [Pseudomonadota bacterium]